jgi:hypothetical protein
MKIFVKTFRGKMSYKRIDTYVNLVRSTLDPDDYFDIEIEYDDEDSYQFIKIEVWDRVLH